MTRFANIPGSRTIPVDSFYTAGPLDNNRYPQRDRFSSRIVRGDHVLRQAALITSSTFRPPYLHCHYRTSTIQVFPFPVPRQEHGGDTGKRI